MTPEELLAETATQRYARRLEQLTGLLTMASDESNAELHRLAKLWGEEDDALAAAKKAQRRREEGLRW